MFGFDLEKLPYTETKDFRVLSLALGDQPLHVYGVYNKLTGHTEMVWSQLSQAVISMQTAQQTLERVRSGEANGYFQLDANGKAAPIAHGDL